MATISIFGLGYVGSASIACLADSGHKIIGVDVSATKVDMINAGHSPIIEEGLDELLAKGVSAGRIRATQNAAEAVQASEASFICVGTPSCSTSTAGSGRGRGCPPLQFAKRGNRITNAEWED